jgi:hypothetical protein
MRRWISLMIISSMIGFLLSLCLSAAFAIDKNRGGKNENSHRSLGLYLNSAEAIGGGNYNEDYDDPGPGKGWGGNHSTMRRAMNYEDWMRREVAHRSGNLSNLPEEERAKLYDWLGREMHLLQDMAHSSPDSLSLGPLPEQIPGEQEKGDIQK